MFIFKPEIKWSNYNQAVDLNKVCEAEPIIVV